MTISEPVLSEKCIAAVAEMQTMSPTSTDIGAIPVYSVYVMIKETVGPIREIDEMKFTASVFVS